MCGINAIMVGEDKTTRVLIKLMNEKTAHRGPDASGMFISKDRRVGLAHNRLSIIDLNPRGNQPMTDFENKATIVFNGEIYNYQDIKRELVEKGHKFRTESDTEVILEAYKEFGYECVNKLNGMFAFIIYDKKDKTLFLARDRIGEKPLVYFEGDDIFIASSEIPALLATGEIKKEISEEAVGYYFLHNFFSVPDPLTIFKGVYKLKSSHYMVVKDSKVIKYERYWTPSFKKIDRSDPIDDFTSAIKEAVKSRKISDVPVSVLLSGGLDSSTIIAFLNEPDIHSYAFGVDKNDEEFRRAKQIADLFRSHHKEVLIQQDQLQILKNLIGVYGEPIYLLPLSYSYSISKEIRTDGLKVAITGNGGDELLFGYDGSNRLMSLSYLFKLTDIIPRKVFSILSSLAWGEMKTVLSMMSVDITKRKGEIYRHQAKDLLPNLMAPVIYEKIKEYDFGSLIDQIASLCNSEWYIENSYWCGLMLENSHSITISGDLPPMYHAVEFRAPFLDHRLAELIFSLHPRLKVGSLIDKRKNKLILKKAMEGILPNDIIYAKKMGFGYNVTPRDRLRSDWKNEVEQKVLNGAYLSSGLFNIEFIRKTIHEHMSGKIDNTKLILGLYAFELWYSSFMVVSQ